MTESDYQPQYRQIERALRERIARLSPGARLPSDTDCARSSASAG
jgi:DNA-binding GntR family transcriptional regulator